jgi:hypothetical protein
MYGQNVGFTVKKNAKNNGPKKVDNRDELPFEILEESDQHICLGTFALDKGTSCGDLIDLGSRGIWRVKKVRFLYKFRQGKFRVFKKKLDVQPAKTPVLSPRGTGDEDDAMLQ